MAGGLFSLAKLFAITLRESANDGSDFTNPDADFRRVFLGEDGQLHAKDSSGTVTDLTGGGGGGGATVGAKAYASGAQSLNDVVIPLDSEEFDSDGFHSTSSNTARMTIPTAMSGTYLIVGGSFVNGASRLYIRKNGSTNLRPTGQSLAAAGYCEVCVVAQLSATDYVEILPAAGTTRTYGDNSEEAAKSSLTVIRLGT